MRDKLSNANPHTFIHVNPLSRNPGSAPVSWLYAQHIAQSVLCHMIFHKLFACWVIFHVLIFFSKLSSFFKKKNHIQSAKRLDQDQDRHYVGPDLNPNCLQRLSADDKGHR